MLIRDIRSLLVVTFVACSGHGAPSGSQAAPAPVVATPKPVVAPPPPSPAVTAARAFLDTLSDEQRNAVLFAFDDSAQRARWSNFPTGFVPRSGVRWGALNATQRAALLGLLGAVLSPAGVTMVQEQMAADDIIKQKEGSAGPRRGPPGDHRGPPPKGAPAGPGSGRPSVNFGSDFYYVSFVGTPSTTSPWMLQFGGHHLAINATVVGAQMTLSPTLTGGEPLKFQKDGKAVYIAEKEVRKAAALLGSLSAEQRKKAIISSHRIDLVLGPGHDGQVLQPEGLAGGEMTEDQRAKLLGLVEARLEILNADASAAAMVAIRKHLEQTSFAWWGDTRTLGDAYFRVTGPTVLIEYAPQDLDGDATDHAHNMYRDPTNEYGAAWTPLK